jgi:hypothetical protein
MKFKFVLNNLETGSSTQYRTLKEIVDVLDIPYHQARSLHLADQKQFLHPKIKDLYNKYRILSNI